MWAPTTLRDWLSLFWFVLVRPEPPTVHTSDDPNDYCPMCGQRLEGP